MSGFWASLFAEVGPRRKRMREMLGDWGEGLSGFLLLGGLVVGSLGLFAQPWMLGAEPWGLAMPLVWAAGYVLIDWRRQAAFGSAQPLVAAEADTHALRDVEAVHQQISRRYDWAALLWGFACALAGAAAFTMAWGAKPEPPVWTPPPDAVSVDISP